MYENLVKYSGNRVSVLTSKYNHNTRESIARPDLGPEALFTVKYLQSPNVKCNSLFDSIWFFLRYDLPTQARVLIKAFSLQRRHNFEIICIGELQMQGWLTIALKWLTPAKTILYIHGEELTTNTSSRFLGKNARPYLSRADGIVAVSNFTKSVITDVYGIDSKKVRLISNGIDLAELRPASTPNRIVNQYIKSGSTLIFAVSRLIERKGFDKAIDAINIVLKKNYHVQYVIAGSGEMNNRLSQQIKDLGLQSSVTLIGKLSHGQLISFLQNCDIFLMPNRELDNGDTEGFGLVFLEANAFGKPVIGGRYGGAVDAIIDEKTGLLVESNSPECIANAIIRLIDDKKLRRDLGNGGRRWARANDAKNKAQDFLAFCTEVTEREG